MDALIEHTFPAKYISSKGAHERYLRRGHPNAIKTWWARRPIIPMRGLIYASCLKLSRNSDSIGDHLHIIKKLCSNLHPSKDTLKQAIQAIEKSTGRKKLTLLDFFSGGGSIPLEGARLGLETHSLELNPVAYLLQLGILVVPKKYPDITEEVAKWGKYVLDRSKKELRYLFPSHEKAPGLQNEPIVLYWARRVKCPNEECDQSVCLSRLTHLAKRKNKVITLDWTPDKENGGYIWTLSKTEKIAEESPTHTHWRNSLECDFCGTKITYDYLKRKGSEGKIPDFLQCAAFKNPFAKGKFYITRDELDLDKFPDNDRIDESIKSVEEEIGHVPQFELKKWSGIVNPTVYGFETADKLFNKRQLLVLLTVIKYIRKAHVLMIERGYSGDKADSVTILLTALVDHLADWNCMFTMWIPQNEQCGRSLAGPGLAMRWDYIEINPFSDGPANLYDKLNRMVSSLRQIRSLKGETYVRKGSARKMPYPDAYFDVMVTDPPYFDSLFYAVLSDCFLPWQKLTLRGIVKLEEELDMDEEQEVIAARHRSGNVEVAIKRYQEMITDSLREAARTLKDRGVLTMVYSHKTIEGWSVIADAIRSSPFVVTATWPLRMERRARPRAMKSDALSSVVAMIMRKKEKRPAKILDNAMLEEIYGSIKQLIERLKKMEFGGSDLLVAVVGHSLNYYTSYESLLNSDGERVSFEGFYNEIQRILKRTLHIQDEQTLVKSSLFARLDHDTTTYLLWRLKYGQKSLTKSQFRSICKAVGGIDVYEKAILGEQHYVFRVKGQKVEALRFDQRDSGFLQRRNVEALPVIDSLHRLLSELVGAKKEVTYSLPDDYDKIKPQLLEIMRMLAGTELTTTEDRSVAGEKTAIRKVLSGLV